MKRVYFALLINDMQNDFVLSDGSDPVTGACETIPVIDKLLALARHEQLAVFHLVREYRSDGSDVEITRLPGFVQGHRYAVPGTYGCEIIQELTPLPGEYRIVRNRFSGFMQTELDFVLRRLGVEQLILCGTQYPNCVRSTAFDAICLDYKVTVITDATSGANQAVIDANIADMRNIGIVCETLEQFTVRLGMSAVPV